MSTTDDAPPEYVMVMDIDHCRALPHLGNEPTIAEMNTGIDWMANNKSPGESTVPAEAFKALLPLAHEVLHCMLCAFWNGACDYDEWKTALLRILYKERAMPTSPQIIAGLFSKTFLHAS